MRYRGAWILGLLLCCCSSALAEGPTWGRDQQPQNLLITPESDPFLTEILSKMTWEEKCGQLNQYAGELTGPQPLKPELRERIRSGELGSVLSISEVERCRSLQDEAMQSRLRIPLLFAFDVIHGYRTVFPIPLAEAASWDLELAEQSTRIAATEASSAGISWSFAPMLDIARDPRWGRIIEGAGEDPYLASQFARARVRGFQGTSLSEPDTVAATAKHLGGYGAAEGGRDYDTAELSERTMREIYLRPFEAAMEEGVATVMPSFHETGGVPCHSSTFLLTDILREEWGFPGVVVSDYGAIEELMAHRVAANPKQAGELALKAGVDIDMMSDIFRTLEQTPENVARVDAAVLRVLALKKALGLFDDPYRYLDAEREMQTILKPEYRSVARRAAARSAVLLENRDELLPLDTTKLKKVAVVGPLADDARSALGEWNLVGRVEDTVSALSGLKQGFAELGIEVRYVQGCPAWDADDSNIPKAVNLARDSDLVILVLGEPFEATGESRNRTSIGLPGSQLQLAQAMASTGKPVVTVLMNGRPLTLEEVAEVSPTLMVLWHAGLETGNALFELLTGSEPLGGKLPVTFPRRVGQIPIYYNRKVTGRPPSPGQDKYRLDYYDAPLTPLYPFGYGLSTSTFELTDIRVGSVSGTWPLRIQATLTNTGPRRADEVVQLYLSQRVRSMAPPEKELRGFTRVTLEPKESQEITFNLNQTDLKFVGRDMRLTFEAGEFDVAVGFSSDVSPQLRVHLEQTGLSKVSELKHP